MKERKRWVYIAGPMRHHICYNAPAFIEQAKHLRRSGYRVISPYELDVWIHHFDGMLCDPADPCNGAPVFKSWLTRRTKKFNLMLCIIIDLLAVLWCDEILALPGCEDSVGATAELAVAKWAGKPKTTIRKYYDADDLLDQMSVAITLRGNPNEGNRILWVCEER